MHDSPPAITAAESSRQRLLAIGLACAAVACFTLIDTTAKLLVPRIGIIETTWLRYSAALAMILPFVNPWRVPGLLHSERPHLQLLRGLLLFASTAMNFIALQHLQLAQTVSINFLAPLMFALLAGPLLGEWAGPRRLVAIAVGFIGVLIVARPGLGIIHPAALLTMTGATSYTIVLLITRNLSARDSVETTLFYSTAIGVVLLGPFALHGWNWPSGVQDWGLIALCGFGASMGHWLMILAQRHVPAPVIAPFIYTQIVWMTGAGYVVFGDIPDLWTFVGGGIVIASGLYLLHRERVRKAAPAPLA